MNIALKELKKEISEKWQNHEKEAEADIKNKKVSGPYNSIKDLLKQLKK